MIARCPECRTRYRIAREKIGDSGARIRCARCTTVFRVEAPPEDPPVEMTPLPDEEPVTPALTDSPTTPRAPLGHALVAEPDAEMAKQIAELLEHWRIEPHVVHDGGEALLHMHRHRPDFAVLGGHLPGLGAPMLAELVRRTGELESIQLLRIAPLGEPATGPEFEANDTLEPADLPEGVASFMERHGLGERPATAEPEPEPELEPERAVAEPAPAPAEDSSPDVSIALDTVLPEEPVAPRRPRRAPTSDDPKVAAAERLARIIVSDIILYNEEKFGRGVEDGNVVAMMQAEIDEASELFRQRIPEEVREKRDFLAEELERRAAAARD